MVLFEARGPGGREIAMSIASPAHRAPDSAHTESALRCGAAGTHTATGPPHRPEQHSPPGSHAPAPSPCRSALIRRPAAAKAAAYGPRPLLPCAPTAGERGGARAHRIPSRFPWPVLAASMAKARARVGLGREAEVARSGRRPLRPRGFGHAARSLARGRTAPAWRALDWPLWWAGGSGRGRGQCARLGSQHPDRSMRAAGGPGGFSHAEEGRLSAPRLGWVSPRSGLRAAGGGGGARGVSTLDSAVGDPGQGTASASEHPPGWCCQRPRAEYRGRFAARPAEASR